MKAFGEKTVADWGCMSIVGAEVGKTEQNVPMWNIVGNVLYNFQKVLWKWSFVDCCYQVPKKRFCCGKKLLLFELGAVEVEDRLAA